MIVRYIFDISNTFDAAMEIIEETIFYHLEKSIKIYRQFAQKRINEHGFDITIDQWLILKVVQDKNDISQQQIANMIFKDMASVTRMIELLVKKEYLQRDFHKTDRRRFRLIITARGKKVIQKLTPIIKTNRQTALQNFTQKEIEGLKKALSTIIINCS